MAPRKAYAAAATSVNAPTPIARAPAPSRVRPGVRTRLTKASPSTVRDRRIPRNRATAGRRAAAGRHVEADLAFVDDAETALLADGGRVLGELTHRAPGTADTPAGADRAAG